MLSARPENPQPKMTKSDEENKTLVYQNSEVIKLLALNKLKNPITKAKDRQHHQTEISSSQPYKDRDNLRMRAYLENFGVRNIERGKERWQEFSNLWNDGQDRHASFSYREGLRKLEHQMPKSELSEYRMRQYI